MQAKKIKVTVSTVEATDGDDFSIKTKIKTKEVKDSKRPLMESTIEIEAVRYKNWLDQAKITARANSLKGTVYSESCIYWVANGEEKAKNDDAGDSKTPTLSELRAKYPDIKATSVAVFLEKVKELPQGNGKENKA